MLFRSIAAVDAAEQFANGLVTVKQSASARNAAYAAAAYAADAADAADAAARKTAKQAQMNYLRQNCKPNFT